MIDDRTIARLVQTSTAASGVPLRLEDLRVVDEVARSVRPFAGASPPDAEEAPGKGPLQDHRHQADDLAPRYRRRQPRSVAS